MKCRKAITFSLATAVAALGISLFMGTGAWAQAARPCASDIEKFCGTVKFGGGRIAQCLKQNEAKLAPACKTRIAELKEQLMDIKEACHDDVEQLCPGVKPGQGRVLGCLKEKRANVSGECKEAVSELR
jgi:hypothetical protein